MQWNHLLSTIPVLNSPQFHVSAGDSSNYFHLDKNTGVIQILTALDYDSVPSYEVEVIATDTGALAATSTVTITVVDVDDESPTCNTTAFR